MPLSEHEQRMFEELERELRGEIKTPLVPARGSRWFVAGLVFLAGLGVVIAAVAIQLIVIGVVGFIAMLAALLLVTSSKPGAKPARNANKPPKPAPRPSSGSFFEDRWDRRNGN